MNANADMKSLGDHGVAYGFAGSIGLSRRSDIARCRARMSESVRESMSNLTLAVEAESEGSDEALGSLLTSSCFFSRSASSLGLSCDFSGS